MNNGLQATIVQYRGKEDIDLQFENGEIICGMAYSNYKRGQIACPLIIDCVGNGAAIVTNPNCKPAVTFIIDEDDIPFVSSYWWSLDRHGYAKNSHTGIRVHRIVMNAKDDDVIDHIDGNPLNNRKENLRICTQFDNQKNRGANKNNKSGYKGVCWNSEKKKWTTQLFSNGRRVYCKHFDDKETAARAYNEAALKHHGEFAKLNEI